MARILIADDSPVSLELLRYILKSLCDELVEASDGQEALEKALRLAPDLVLLDLEMPNLDGYAILSQLKREPGLAHTRVVAVTARAMQGERERGLAQGFDGYITKPVDPAGLRQYVKSLLQN